MAMPTQTLAPVLIVEAAAGLARRRWLEDRLREMAEAGAATWMLPCDFDSGGPWAGVEGLFSALLPEMQARRPDLVDRHVFELVHVLPHLRGSLTVARPSLTDIAAPQEKVRNYAADRAFRIVHGLIDLLDSWKSAACPATPWVIACDGYEAGGAIGRRFFRELMRRRRERLCIRLLAGVDPGKARETAASFDAGLRTEIVSLDLPAEQASSGDPATFARLAAELEERVGADRGEKQAHLPELIRLWTLANRLDKVVRLRYFGMVVYIHLGLYEDGLRYGDGLLPLADAHVAEDERLRWWIIINLLNCYMGMQDAGRGLSFAEREAVPILEQAGAEIRVQLLYLISMLYARFQKPRDFAKGEEYLDRALAVIEQSGLPDDDRHFQAVFNRNGVAMIRTFQGRHQDAIELCRSGLERLNAHIGAEKHRLHRSVLIYNIAQVYQATGSYAQAIEYFSAVMDMDPNYSEYHNERGNIFLKLGRLEEARADYLRAIELSPPYFEVFTNLGQCYRRMGRLNEAIEWYSRALDLEPDQPLALEGRAKAHEELGDAASAIDDYSAALARDSKTWQVIASRGVLYYETGNLQASLADFDRALELAPQERGLYGNRSMVFAGLGRRREAAGDIEKALFLNPFTEEKKSLEARLHSLLNTTS